MNGEDIAPLSNGGVKSPSSLKECTIANTHNSRASYGQSVSSVRPLSPRKDNLKASLPVRPVTIPERVANPITLSPLADEYIVSKARRWSSLAQFPRRNSFPSTRKDGIENLRALRAELKLAKETGRGPILTKRRKNTLPGALSGRPVSLEIDGYFSSRSNVDTSSDTRTRSSTTPGVVPSPIPVTIRRGPHMASNSLTSRFESIRREPTRDRAALPTTLWDYLILEMENFEIRGVEEYKKERLSNFLRIPESFERA